MALAACSRREASHSRRVILYMIHSRPYSATDPAAASRLAGRPFASPHWQDRSKPRQPVPLHGRRASR
jgi:hypothetical protein